MEETRLDYWKRKMEELRLRKKDIAPKYESNQIQVRITHVKKPYAVGHNQNNQRT